MTRRDRGSGTVFVLIGVMVLGVVVVLLAGVGGAYRAHARARAAADLAALAAADRAWSGPGPACALAGQVARRNGVRLTSCDWQGGVVRVRVAADLTGWLAPVGPAMAEARADPT